jgi:hypothetical protein
VKLLPLGFALAACGGREPPELARNSVTPDGGRCVSSVLERYAATASSETQAAARAIDGDFATRWASGQGTATPEWIAVDMGALVFIDRVRIDWQTACARDYELQVADVMSNDAGVWTPIKSITGNAAGGGEATSWASATGSVDHVGLSGVGRYLRIYATLPCKVVGGYSIYEIEVSGSTDYRHCVPE